MDQPTKTGLRGGADRFCVQTMAAIGQAARKTGELLTTTDRRREARIERYHEHRREMELKYGYPPVAPDPNPVRIGGFGFFAGCLALGLSAVTVAAIITLASASPMEWIEAYEAAKAAASN